MRRSRSANSETQRAADLQQSIDTLNAKVSQERADFDRLTTTRQAASEALKGAQQAELSEKALLDAVRTGGPGGLVEGSEASSAPRLPGLIKAVVPAVVVATGLAIAMIVLLEVVGPVRLPARGRSTAADRGDGGSRGHEQGGSEAAADEDDEDEEPERDPAGRIVRSRA